MKNLLVLPFHDMKFALNYGFSTRDSHIYEYFIQDPEIDKVIIINRPTSLAELILGRKKFATNNNVIYRSKGLLIQELKKNVFIVDIFVTDLLKVAIKKHAWLPEVYSSNKIINRVRKALKILDIQNYSTYMSSPFTVELGLKLKSDALVLDAVDNLTKFENWTYFKDKIEKLYQIALDNFEHIVVNSKDTLEYFGDTNNAEIEFIANGADAKNFVGTFDLPEDLPKGKPIVGYAGKIQRMFDTELFTNLAKSNPDLNFVIIGKVLDEKRKREFWLKHLKEYKNVFFLGFKKYDYLPAYYNNFDLCIIPYIIENQHGGDPIKFYEYMASNKPIISMNIGEIKTYHDGKNIHICDTRSEFKSAFEWLKNNYLNLEPYPDKQFNTWDKVADRIKMKLFPAE